MKGKNVIFERDMEVADIRSITEEKNGKQTKEVEIRLRGRDCLLALRRFGMTTTQLIDGENVMVKITRYK